MHRPRSFTFLIGAILALLTLYTFFGSKSPDREVLKTPLQATSVQQTPPDKDEKLQKPFHDKGPDLPSNEEPQEHNDNEYVAEVNHSNPLVDHKSSRPKTSSKPVSIKRLIQNAENQFQETLSHRTNTLNEAAAAYRDRRGRHPPPGFDRWYNYAMDNDAIMVEEFFDQIYHDLNPFWAIDPKILRAQARAEERAVEVIGGRAKATTDWFWHQIWARMINETSDYLPDMYIAMNAMDESRLLVKWETIDEYMKIAEDAKSLVPLQEVITQIEGWGREPDQNVSDIPDPKWNGFNIYKYARSACPPDSPARKVGGILATEKVLGEYKRNSSNPGVKRYFDGSFVSNYTEASDFCHDATIGGLHGALMQPLTCSTSDVLMPMFGGSKFRVNNEILLPAPMYWNEEVRFGGGDGDQVPWDNKTSTVIWRGTATGGRTKPYTWNLFHRHRFVAMTNGTKYRIAGTTDDPIFSPFFRKSAIKQLQKPTQAHLSKWLDSTHDVSFTNLVCDENESDGGCWYTNDEFKMTPGIEFAEQFTHKYVPDIDGNSFSGRYRAFLLSNSLPIKATIYREWHDSRLIAWKHFVPMNNRFSDYYSILEYFLGSKTAGLRGHDSQAKKIAIDGREWAEKVLRKVDMQIYVGRLLLEYARITDDNRAILGWVEDLLSESEAD